MFAYEPIDYETDTYLLPVSTDHEYPGNLITNDHERYADE